jgi:hypothetical protein
MDKYNAVIILAEGINKLNDSSYNILLLNLKNL